MYFNNEGSLGMSDKNSENPSIYDLASKQYDLFMEWAEKTIKPLPSTPSHDYIQRKYSEYLKENNTDEYGNKLPSPNEP